MPQIVDQTCVVCQQRIAVATNAAFCSNCGCAFHNRCAQSGMCPKCGAALPTPAPRVAPDPVPHVAPGPTAAPTREPASAEPCAPWRALLRPLILGYGALFILFGMLLLYFGPVVQKESLEPFGLDMRIREVYTPWALAGFGLLASGIMAIIVGLAISPAPHGSVPLPAAEPGGAEPRRPWRLRDLIGIHAILFMIAGVLVLCFAPPQQNEILLQTPSGPVISTRKVPTPWASFGFSLVLTGVIGAIVGLAMPRKCSPRERAGGTRIE